MNPSFPDVHDDRGDAGPTRRVRDCHPSQTTLTSSSFSSSTEQTSTMRESEAAPSKRLRFVV